MTQLKTERYRFEAIKRLIVQFHPFFTVGTLGMILIACLHMFFSLGLSITSIHTSFFVLYPVFLTFLILGVILTVKSQKDRLHSDNKGS